MITMPEKDEEKRKGPIRRFLDGEPILRRRIQAKENAEPKKETTTLESKPNTGRTFQEQSDIGYCLECISGHTMTALTEMRHALDRYRTSGEMTEGVQEKVRNSIAELMGITYDVKDLSKASPEVEKGLNEILDEVRWIRKDAESAKGLTRGYGSEEDLENLRNKIFALQNKAYSLYQQCPTCKPKGG